MNAWFCESVYLACSLCCLITGNPSCEHVCVCVVCICLPVQSWGSLGHWGVTWPQSGQCAEGRDQKASSRAFSFNLSLLHFLPEDVTCIYFVYTSKAFFSFKYCECNCRKKIVLVRRKKKVNDKKILLYLEKQDLTSPYCATYPLSSSLFHLPTSSCRKRNNMKPELVKQFPSGFEIWLYIDLLNWLNRFEPNRFY